MSLLLFFGLGRCLQHNRRAIAVNGFIIVFLIIYTTIGGFIFLNFEFEYQQYMKQNATLEKRLCIESLLNRDNRLRLTRASDVAAAIAERCLTENVKDDRMQWSFKSAALYSLGILTTLGYGKIEPQTINGRISTVIYGFFGIPLTVILLTNFGRYLEAMATRFRRLISCRRRREDEDENVSGSTLFFIVLVYLILGATMIPLMSGQFDFFNGIYYAFICLTAIEYGDIIPQNNWFLPISVFYMCTGLAISTIALDIGSIYVRKLHFIGKKIKNIANIRIWFGARNLEVRELITAVGQNIGIDQNVIADIDIDTLVKTAIQVKLGRLSRVPQTHMIVEGIWPPELVPLFMKDGQFPLFVDSEDDLTDMRPKKFSVHFEDEPMMSEIEDTSDSETAADKSQTTSSRLSPIPRRRAMQAKLNGSTDSDQACHDGVMNVSTTITSDLSTDA
ncbi:Potassium channel domain-containing protein [Caenorhabditis elegans]|uniref:Potassium channel domain-containing protein n=1 Tax=Caenorhabditis elegans TaxID=6239 RepID=Q564V7_CAEEL|nr:Potassium channel domain-containing protein [Caenorhabditis elegans]CAI79227.1 Potassium channel domain-containing protein [Caenorhabditis elegans]|eukprot:NP_001021468.1 TWiK family of potassium channels [Caenorhabditis elegans]